MEKNSSPGREGKVFIKQEIKQESEAVDMNGQGNLELSIGMRTGKL